MEKKLNLKNKFFNYSFYIQMQISPHIRNEIVKDVKKQLSVNPFSESDTHRRITPVQFNIE
jgi:hypothetical protein